MQIHNAVITGSFSYNGADLSSISSSNANSASVSSILTSVSSSQQQISSSYIALSASYNVASSSLSSRTTQIERVYATTGSNGFTANQAITGSLTVTGQIVAQTLNVQQVTSSIVYSSGSNIFGCDINSRQTFTGSFYQTGSVACFSNTIKVGANNTLTSGNINLGGYPTSICFGNAQSIYDNGVGGLAINGQSGIQFLTCATASLNLNSSGFFGVGTTTPCRELHVKGEILFQSRSPFSTNNSVYRFIPRSLECAFQFQLMNDAVGTETTVWSVCRNAQTVTSFNIENGNVGIGTTAPSTLLHAIIPTCWAVNGTVVNSYPIATFSQCDCAGGARGLQIGVPTGGVNSPVFLKVNNTSARFSIIDQSNCENFTISGGSVGIGTASPQVALHVVRTSGSPRVDISTTDSYSTACSLYLAQSGTYSTVEAYNYAANTGAILSLNPSGGNVGVGNTTPGRKLTVQDTGCVLSLGLSCFDMQAKGVEVYNNCSGNTDNIIGYWISTGPHKAGIGSGRTNAASTWEVDLRFYTHPTTIGSLNTSCENMRLYGDGSLVTRAGASSPGLYSDINLKENLSKIPSALNKIQCINGYTFDWKDNAPTRTTPSLLNVIHDAGLIAQEVESVLPDIVRENDLNGIKMLNYNGITALLIEGIKEQQCTINLLKTCLGIS